MNPYKACWVLQPIRKPIYIEIGCVCGNNRLGRQSTFEFGGDVPWKLSGILIGFGLMLLTFLQAGSVQTVFPLILVIYWILRHTT